MILIWSTYLKYVHINIIFSRFPHFVSNHVKQAIVIIKKLFHLRKMNEWQNKSIMCYLNCIWRITCLSFYLHIVSSKFQIWFLFPITRIQTKKETARFTIFLILNWLYVYHKCFHRSCPCGISCFAFILTWLPTTTVIDNNSNQYSERFTQNNYNKRI